jgi:phosphoribosyl-AMP cyclohydrolase / phosphoribosyl-ATP pyrophosphohydrolase
MTINFEKLGGLVPAVVQDSRSNRVLMLGFMNEEALARTKAEGRVVFFSRTRRELWCKGETSGNFLQVERILQDCDNDSLLIYAIPSGPVCHTGDDTCFGEENRKKDFLSALEGLIAERRVNGGEGSYTAKLFKEGLNRIAQKVGEEAVEVVIAAKDEDPVRFKNEAADLVYHLLVLLREKGMEMADILAVLEGRQK